MSPPLIAGIIAALACAIVVASILAVKLANARIDLDEANERNADLKLAHGLLEQVNAELLTELTEFRNAKAKRLANLSRGTPKPKLVA